MRGRPIPLRERCISCGQRSVPGDARCQKCIYRDEQSRPSPWPMNLSERPLPRNHVQQSEKLQREVLRVLSTCEYCGLSGGHTSHCSGYASFIDVAEEYEVQPLEEYL